MKNDLLKFITCGSVNDGKSTLIGRMLYDAKLLFADQKRALELDSKAGFLGGEMDYSLLLDGLMAEREQGSTIDVSYRYFATEKRSFIVADTPGHEEYTRNMAVGTSFASLSVILTDASQGVLIQTKRHARICHLMGIKHFVFAVNKMDLVNYSQERFRKIEKDIKMLMAEFDYESIKMIPLSATEGDNITKKSDRMPWYHGVSLLEYLENVDVGEAVTISLDSENDVSRGCVLEKDSDLKVGSKILIDRITNRTSACGVVEHSISKENNLTWHNMDITRELRESQLNQKAVTVWLTGLSGSGKSTIANALEKRLFSMGKHTMILDGDNVRMGLNKNLGFDEKDRIENIRRIAEVAKLMNDAGLIVLTAFISPYRHDRRKAKQIIGDSFIEVYVSTSLEECERRDVKGLYKAARAGKIFDFTGISSPYEVPENPDITVDTKERTVEECVDIILKKIGNCSEQVEAFTAETVKA